MVRKYESYNSKAESLKFTKPETEFGPILFQQRCLQCFKICSQGSLETFVGFIWCYNEKI